MTKKLSSLCLYCFFLSLLNFNFSTDFSNTIVQNEDTNFKVSVENLGKPINTKYNEYSPSLILNDQLIFFQSDRPDYGKESNKYDIWYSNNLSNNATNPHFQVPINIANSINTMNFEGMPILRKINQDSEQPSNNDRYEMFFVSENFKNGIHQNSDIFRSVYFNNQWSKPEPIHEINTVFEERMPFISLDGSILLFSSNRPGGYGKDDIWVSKFDTERQTWTKPKNLGAQINTEASEVSPSLYDRNQTLYYSSNRLGGLGGYDIYMSEILRRNSVQYPLAWSNSKNLGTPYNSPYDDERPILAHNRNYMYFSSNRTGGFGQFDIYRATIINSIRAQLYIVLKAKVIDKVTQEPLLANIHVRNNTVEWDISTMMPNGDFSLDMDNHERYLLRISKAGYKTYESVLFFRDYNVKEGNSYQKTFSLIPLSSKDDIQAEEQLKLTLKVEEEKGIALKKDIPPNKPTTIPKKKIILPKKTSINPKPESISKKSKPIDNVPTNDLLLPEAQTNSNSLIQDIDSSTADNNSLEEGGDTLNPENMPTIEDETLIDAQNPENTLPKELSNNDPIVETVAKDTLKEKNNDTKEPEAKLDIQNNAQPTLKKDDVAPNNTIDDKKELSTHVSKLLAIYFDINEAVILKAEERVKLYKIQKISTDNPNLSFVVSGHTDTTEASKDKKIALSRKRALFIRNELISLGIPVKKISAEWYSDSNLAIPEVNNESVEQNRRVEVFTIEIK